MAAGRRTSVDTITGFLPWRFSQRPSLADVVVLPAPWRPSSSTTRGLGASFVRPPSVPAKSASSSSRTIFTTCCAGDRLRSTAWSIARSRTRSMNALTTLKLTSASSSARRISRSTSSTCDSVRRTSPLRAVKAFWIRELSESNIVYPDRTAAAAARADGAS